MTRPSSMGLVLTGGGARAAYQVGVLKAISDMMPGLQDPFRVICGTSAGAINAMGLATGEDIFRHNIAHLEHLWAEIKPEDVYRFDAFSLTRRLQRFIPSLLSGKTEEAPGALLDNRPLRDYLTRAIKPEALNSKIERGNLNAVGITACGYTTGQNLCFFQGHPDIPSWNRIQRLGVRCTLGIDHLMASSAIPTLFPPVKIHREYFGDGATRQIAHISPALYLGASRVLVIGVSANRVAAPRRRQVHNIPTVAQVMENVLNGIFLDTLEYDIERLELINQLLELIPAKKLEAAGLDLRPVGLLQISPSYPIDDIAVKYINSLPLMVRRMMGRSLEVGEGGVSLASYLLFDKNFCRDLIKLGYRDAQTHAKELQDFFSDKSEPTMALARSS